jgi:hypothetical protein
MAGCDTCIGGNGVWWTYNLALEVTMKDWCEGCCSPITVGSCSYEYSHGPDRVFFISCFGAGSAAVPMHPWASDDCPSASVLTSPETRATPVMEAIPVSAATVPQCTARGTGQWASLAWWHLEVPLLQPTAHSDCIITTTTMEPYISRQQTNRHSTQVQLYNM